MSTLSASITNSQNVVKFIYEHKDCDSIIFTKELNNLDLINKLKLIEMIFIDIIKKHSNNEEEYIQIIKYIKHPHEIEELEKNFIILLFYINFIK